MKTIAITIGDDTLRRIDTLISRKRSGAANRSLIIRQAVEEYLTSLERLADEERETEIFRKHRSRLAREADALVRDQAKP